MKKTLAAFLIAFSAGSQSSPDQPHWELLESQFLNPTPKLINQEL